MFAPFESSSPRGDIGELSIGKVDLLDKEVAVSLFSLEPGFFLGFPPLIVRFVVRYGSRI